LTRDDDKSSEDGIQTLIEAGLTEGIIEETERELIETISATRLPTKS